MLKTGINGFGRFSLHLLKYWLDRSKEAHFLISYINDDYLKLDQVLQIIYDDIYVQIPKFYKLSVTGDQLTFMSADGHKSCIIYSHSQKYDIPWLGKPTYFLECSGKNTNSADCGVFLTGHTEKIIISATSWEADKTLIYGFNHSDIVAADKIVSYGSCTVNAYVPLAHYLHSVYGIRNSDVNVIHNIQEYKLKDPKNNTLLRKFCTLEKSGAHLLKFLSADNFIVNYTVVPYAGVSMMDFRFELDRVTSLERILYDLDEAMIGGSLNGLYIFDKEDRGPEVHKCSPYSTIIIRSKARLLGNNLYLQAYFDNENSANRYFDLVNYLSYQYRNNVLQFLNPNQADKKEKTMNEA